MAWPFSKKQNASQVSKTYQGVTVTAPALQSPMDALTRINALVSQSLGIGTIENDPLESLTVNEKLLFGQQARNEYRNMDIVQRIIDAPALDSLKNGFELKTNYDKVCDLGKLIHERLDDLDIKKVLQKFIRNYGIYPKGAMIVPVVLEKDMDTGREHLRKKIRLENLEKIEKLNVVREDLFFYIVQSYDPLARDFEEMQNITVGGYTLHKSRLWLEIDSLDPVRQYGVTQLQRIRTACRGLNIAEWTIVNLLMRYRAAVMKFPSSEAAINASKERKQALKDLIDKIKMSFTSKSVAAIPDNYSMEYLETSFTGLKEACEFLWDFLSSVSHEPQSIIKGSAQGELASAKNDRQTWNSHVKAFYQAQLIDPALQFLFPYIIYEQDGEVLEACQKYGIDPYDVKVTIEHNPLDVPDPLEKAQIENMEAQTIVLLTQNQLMTPEEAKKKLNPEKDDFALQPDVDAATLGDDPLGLFAQTKQNMPDVWKKLQSVLRGETAATKTETIVKEKAEKKNRKAA